MKRIKLTLSYDGTEYNGWQIQTKPFGVKTIQGTLEDRLRRLTGEEIKVVAAGRTDAGVHALGQVVHFDTGSSIPVDRYPMALEGLLPQDIVPLKAELVDDTFHARYSAKGKTYQYTMDQGVSPHVFWRRFAYHYPFPLNLDAMKEAAKLLIGTHDFTSFCASGSSVKDFTRTITSCLLWQEGQFLHFQVSGNGFLYNMVRIMGGTLLEVGRGKIGPRQITDIIKAKSRNAAGPTLPPQGLCLMKVDY
ncbi:MAG: tRNA pseudouridine(38-40) synthase TruA [Zhaonellaceae bacterium]|jgi:tRNA pseudouridine38-40 synthase|nr:tRNA pseudouridine(38-40) synthase TruA [Clostridia bacterium]